MTLMMAPGHLLLQILRVWSLSSPFRWPARWSVFTPADVAFIAFAGRCRLHPLSMYDAAIAILAGVIGGVVAQHFAMQPASCLPGHSRCWRRGLLYPAAFGKRTDDKRN